MLHVSVKFDVTEAASYQAVSALHGFVRNSSSSAFVPSGRFVMTSANAVYSTLE